MRLDALASQKPLKCKCCTYQRLESYLEMKQPTHSKTPNGEINIKSDHSKPAECTINK